LSNWNVERGGRNEAKKTGWGGREVRAGEGERKASAILKRSPTIRGPRQKDRQRRGGGHSKKEMIGSQMMFLHRAREG